MEFDKRRVFTALNADGLRAGDKVIVSMSLNKLREKIECANYPITTLTEVLSDDFTFRFRTETSSFPLAYLVERNENCTNCAELGKAGGCCPLDDDDGKTTRCWLYKPKTEQKAEPTYKGVNYRPFRDTDELIKVWLDKGSKWQKREITEPFIWVRYKDNKHIPQKGTLIRTFFEEAVSVDEKYLSLETLFKDYEFLDGSPCGVEE